jgi:hypothetical protein
MGNPARSPLPFVARPPGSGAAHLEGGAHPSVQPRYRRDDLPERRQVLTDQLAAAISSPVIGPRRPVLDDAGIGSASSSGVSPIRRRVRRRRARARSVVPPQMPSSWPASACSRQTERTAQIPQIASGARWVPSSAAKKSTSGCCLHAPSSIHRGSTRGDIRTLLRGGTARTPRGDLARPRSFDPRGARGIDALVRIERELNPDNLNKAAELKELECPGRRVPDFEFGASRTQYADPSKNG